MSDELTAVVSGHIENFEKVSALCEELLKETMAMRITGRPMFENTREAADWLVGIFDNRIS